MAIDKIISVIRREIKHLFLFFIVGLSSDKFSGSYIIVQISCYNYFQNQRHSCHFACATNEAERLKRIREKTSIIVFVLLCMYFDTEQHRAKEWRLLACVVSMILMILKIVFECRISWMVYIEITWRFIFRTITKIRDCFMVRS